MLWEMLQVAWDSLMANKLRSVLTTLGVLIGVAAVITMLAIGQGAREQQLQLIQQMGANVVLVFPGQFRRGAVGFGMGSVQTLTMRDIEALSKGNALIVQVAAEVRRVAQVVYRQKNTSTSVVGVTANYPVVRAYKVEKGRFFTEHEDLANARVAVLGQTVVANLFGENANPVGKTIRINGIPFSHRRPRKERRFGTDGLGRPNPYSSSDGNVSAFRDGIPEHHQRPNRSQRIRHRSNGGN